MSRTTWVSGFALKPAAGSVQSHPPTATPWTVRGTGQSSSGVTTYHLSVAFTDEQAQKLVRDWVGMGLFGPDGVTLEGGVRL